MHRSLSPTQAQRLSLIKYLFEQAVEQSRRPPPVDAFALLGFHDSAEMFLLLAYEVNEPRLPPDHHKLEHRHSWEDYWKALESLKPAHRAGMGRLNKARIQLKHHGAMPSRLDLEDLRGTTVAFFEENCERLFGRSYQSITLEDVVACHRAQWHLKVAVANRQKGALNSAAEALALSFHELVADYRDRKCIGQYKNSVLPTEGRGSVSSYNIADSDAQMAIDDLWLDIDDLKDTMAIVALGLDFRKYARFAALTPRVERFGGGTRRRPDQITDVDADDVDFCIGFVVESALILQNVDYSLPAFKPSAAGSDR